MLPDRGYRQDTVPVEENTTTEAHLHVAAQVSTSMSWHSGTTFPLRTKDFPWRDILSVVGVDSYWKTEKQQGLWDRKLTSHQNTSPETMTNIIWTMCNMYVRFTSRYFSRCIAHRWKENHFPGWNGHRSHCHTYRMRDEQGSPFLITTDTSNSVNFTMLYKTKNKKKPLDNCSDLLGQN